MNAEKKKKKEEETQPQRTILRRPPSLSFRALLLFCLLLALLGECVGLPGG